MRNLLVPLAIAVFASGAAGQTTSAPLPATPNGCQKAIQSLAQEQGKKIRDTTLSPRYTSDQAKTVLDEFALRCAEQFDPTTIAESTLMDLYTFYSTAERYVKAINVFGDKRTQTLNRALQNTSVDSKERAKRLNAAVQFFSNDPKTYPLVVQYVTELDAVSDVSPADRIKARRALLSVYEDYPEQQLQVANQIEQYVASLDSATRKSVQGSADVTGAKADAYVKQRKPELAVKLYETKIAALDPVKDSTAIKMARRDLKQYQLYGSKAAPIVAQHWLNSDKNTTEYNPENNVSLIMVTAHWCGPCKASYPAIAKMSKVYAKKGVKTVVVTKTFGFFDDQKDISVEDEVEADRKFYVDEYKFSMPMAIFATDTTKDAAGKRQPNPNEEAYAIRGYPTYVVVGRDGAVQDVLVGWGGAKSERELSAALERALKNEQADS